jgi:predicted N-acyltransferase
MSLKSSKTPLSRSGDYRMQVLDDIGAVPAAEWNRLIAPPYDTQPFLQHAFLHALERTGCVGGGSGWLPRHLTMRDEAGELRGAVPLYLKLHSYGEYVFDWAWADAYRRHGLRYYPKLLSAIPFTPVTGTRLLAVDESARAALTTGLMQIAARDKVSSAHVLFPTPQEAALLADAGMMLRQGVQFHWMNRDFTDFESFLAALSQPKRKKIRAERRKVREAGITLRRLEGSMITDRDWSFFVQCYEATYLAHGSTPYLNEAFFRTLGEQMPGNLLLVVAERAGRPIAASLILKDARRMYGRYWGAIESVPCLHFEVAYYQTIEAAIEGGFESIEGGAQGEHKMARGFEPQATHSAHWLAEPAFAQAVDRFLEREGAMMDSYLDELSERLPFRRAGPRESAAAED